MNKTPESELRLAWRLSFPILFAYFPLGAVFALLVPHAGFQWWLGPLMSITIYAGSVQFVALSMMHNHNAIYAIVLAAVFIAFRNSFYGLHLLHRFKTHWFIKSLLIFMLVDANYVILTTHPPQPEHNDIKFCWWLSLLIYLYWIGGAICGAIFSQWVPSFPALKFILPAFFMTLVVNYFLLKRQWHAIVMPIACALIAYVIMPNNYLLLAIVFSLITILAAERFKKPLSNRHA